MIQPHEMKLHLPMTVANGVVSTTTQVWGILVASRDGNVNKVRELSKDCPELLYGQYNYTPPIYFAVREKHTELVKYLLSQGAYVPGYKTYPFLDSLVTIAKDREANDIATLLEEYAANPSLQKYKGDNGEIHYNRTQQQQEFEQAVDKEDINRIESILKQYPEFVKDHSFFWGEGILMMPAKENNREVMELLMRYGATIPHILKWAQYYYFERYDSASFLMEKGMDPNTMSWHHVTLLHDMAQKTDIPKAELLLKYGADINPVDEEYSSTPLGMAARWGHTEMVQFLLKQGADPNKSGASWATPLAWAQKKGYASIIDVLHKSGAK